MKGPPVREKAKEKPQNCHWKETIAITDKPWNIMASADLRLAMPPYNIAMPGTMRKTKHPRITW